MVVLILTYFYYIYIFFVYMKKQHRVHHRKLPRIMLVLPSLWAERSRTKIQHLSPMVRRPRRLDQLSATFRACQTRIQLPEVLNAKLWSNVLLPMTITDGSTLAKKKTEWPQMPYNMREHSGRHINYYHFCALKETAPRAWDARTKTLW